ncbi:phenylacetate--CoA ligase family protein [Solirubrobacter deserti]|uniref:Phenylacetate--CoA ligase n=1 Tax=Solirubrobacter deserti TaxID=2282478 RepID=A0ABT4RD34_9ACTN|nr:phenylacetate--CoA ligase [Solirubrobacter deserti]MDA0136451.1 phenylacetate--CoA ligase [Solirubrobacter deserti]
MPTREAIERVVERVRRTPLAARIPDGWEQLTDLPFTVKDDLREHYPLGLVTVPHDQLRRIHASSGTRGKPTVVAYSQHDLDVWTEVMAYCMTMAGVRPGMVVHNALGYGLFTGGLGFHMGAERIGALVIPASGGVTTRQALLLRDLGGQVLCATPSYALHIAQGLREAGIEDLELRIGMFGAEPWTEAMRAQIEAELGLTALNMYGLSEIIGPGVAAECPEARDGLHVMEDHFAVEVVDPATGAPVPDGTDGELVFTTLTKEAMPLLRYRTGDIASLTREPCPCGRPFARMSAVRGRRDDMLIIRGVNLYPSQIEDVLLGVEGVSPHYQLIVERPQHLDELTVLCEGRGPDLARRVKHAIREQTGVNVRVQVRPMGEIPRSEGKAVRVIDRR